ncbi:hypothetical protein N9299_05620 [Amylibacter sp.]|nr:hypothetical protein [Amylibacter sp.]
MIKARMSQISSSEMTPSKAGIPLLKSVIPRRARRRSADFHPKPYAGYSVFKRSRDAVAN